jgi:ATP phosphoribosyltransferase
LRISADLPIGVAALLFGAARERREIEAPRGGGLRGGHPPRARLRRALRLLPHRHEHGVADCGFVGSDVLGEVGGELLVPLRLHAGRCRLSLLGKGPDLPAPGSQVRLASKYPATARRIVSLKPWGAEIVRLSGSVELAPVLDLAELALDIVQTGRTLAENHLVELEQVEEVAACLVVNRASFQRHRDLLNRWIGRLEAAGVAS